MYTSIITDQHGIPKLIGSGKNYSWCYSPIEGKSVVITIIKHANRFKKESIRGVSAKSLTEQEQEFQTTFDKVR